MGPYRQGRQRHLSRLARSGRQRAALCKFVINREAAACVRSRIPRSTRDHLLLTIKAAGKQGPTIWDLTAQGDQISGVQKTGDRETAQINGVRAPKLDRKMPKNWTKPEPIFNGKDLTGWEPDNPAINHWVAKDGELVNEAHGANLRGTRKFDDFKLHIELNCPMDGNSGVYLRGRYEMQVEYEENPEDTYHSMGSIYGMVPVSQVLPRTPGQWESFDVTFVGRHVTIVRNGVKIIDNQEIAGITGGAIDANEGGAGSVLHPGRSHGRNEVPQYHHLRPEEVRRQPCGRSLHPQISWGRLAVCEPNGIRLSRRSRPFWLTGIPHCDQNPRRHQEFGISSR